MALRHRRATRPAVVFAPPQVMLDLPYRLSILIPDNAAQDLAGKESGQALTTTGHGSVEDNR
jgi:hypothetical protein